MTAYLPLEGVRVLAFEIAYALPAGTRTLADLGAEVVRVAPPARGIGNLISVVDGVFMNKPCMSIDVKNDRGRELAERLVACADVVCNNFTPSVMGRLGLGHEKLMAANPGLIVLQLSGYGTPGPWADFPAYGPSVEAAGGMNRLMGGADGKPVSVGSRVFADQLGGRYAAFALMAALHRRRETGAGQYIDLSMYEAIAHIIGEQLVEASRTGTAPVQEGNRDASMAPQGVYPCAGDDEWIAISIVDDEKWLVLRDLIGDERLSDPVLETLGGRQEAHDEIDMSVREWTARHGKEELAVTLQETGIAASPVRKVSDIHFDPHLEARHLFQTVEHDEAITGHAAHPHAGPGWRSEGYDPATLTDMRWSGRDNARVLAEWLELAEDEIAELGECGALRDAGALNIQPVMMADGGRIDGDVDEDYAERLGLKVWPT